MAVLLGAATAAAQSSGTSGSNPSTTGSSNTSRNQPGASGTYDSSSSPGSTTDTTRSTGSSTSGSDRSTSRGVLTGNSDKLSWGDRRFVNKAADEGKAELAIAQLAAQRATNAEVKNFAQKLVDDHSKVNSELTSLAGQKNVKIDTDDDKDRAYKRLNKKSGAEFDQEFVEHMIDEHEKDIKMFEKAADDAKDPEVRAFASKHVGHFREHLQTAQSLRQTLMPTGRSDASSGRTTSGGTTGSGLGTSSTGSTSTSGTTDTTSSSTSTSGSDPSTKRRDR